MNLSLLPIINLKIQKKLLNDSKKIIKEFVLNHYENYFINYNDNNICNDLTYKSLFEIKKNRNLIINKILELFTELYKKHYKFFNITNTNDMIEYIKDVDKIIDNKEFNNSNIETKYKIILHIYFGKFFNIFISIYKINFSFIYNNIIHNWIVYILIDIFIKIFNIENSYFYNSIIFL